MLEEATTLEKGLPQNLDAERSVLGSVLLDSSSLSFVVPILNQEDFFPDTHRRIFRAMLELYQRSAEIDTLTLKEELDREGGVEKAGGASYLVRARGRGPRREQRRALRADRQGEVHPPPTHPGRPEARAAGPRAGAGRGTAARDGDRRDLRHRRRRDPRRLYARSARSSSTTWTSSRRRATGRESFRGFRPASSSSTG